MVMKLKLGTALKKLLRDFSFAIAIGTSWRKGRFGAAKCS